MSVGDSIIGNERIARATVIRSALSAAGVNTPYARLRCASASF
jgi:hypothetical protein